MRITIESQEEAIAVANALHQWLRKGLEMTGYYVEKINENPYHTKERETMRALERWLSRR